MNLRRCFILTLALTGATAVPAARAAENPYTGIVTRNIFGLVPIPVVDPSAAASATPPPKITPNGIMTIFGKVQVLFKVAGVGQPPKEESYVLGEGERQDDIEVQKIDEPSATITFNNHGTIQELALVAAKASSGAPAPAGPGGFGRAPAIPAPGVAPGAAGNPAPIGFGGRFGRGRPAPGTGSPTAGTGGAPGFSAGTGSQVNEKGIYQPAAEPAGQQLTPEQRILLIEAQRQQGGPTAPLLPPTSLTEGLQNEDGDTGN